MRNSLSLTLRLSKGAARHDRRSWGERQTVLAAGLAVAIGLSGAAPADAAALVRAVRQITAPATTRLIVELSGPARYRLERAAARPELGVPSRIYVDLLDTRLTDAAVAARALPQGPVLRVRGTQPAGSTTRLILDVADLSQYGAFPMLDPFRLIIDVRGAPRDGRPPIEIPGAAPSSVGTRRAAPPPAGSERDTVVASVPRAAGPQPAPAPPPHRFKVVVDPGHGGKDPGALGAGGVAEKDVVLAIALQLRERLAAAGLAVVLTREADDFLPLEERTARANAEQADLFVSIHTNASPNPSLSGIETYYLNNTNDRATIRLAEMENGLRDMTGRSRQERDVSLILSDLIQSYKIEESVTVAEHLQKALVAHLAGQGRAVNDLGVKQGPFYVLVGAGMPCVLVEVSFLTHPEEGARLAHRAYQAAIAEGLLRGIRRVVENTRFTENL